MTLDTCVASAMDITTTRDVMPKLADLSLVLKLLMVPCRMSIYNIYIIYIYIY